MAAVFCCDLNLFLSYGFGNLPFFQVASDLIFQLIAHESKKRRLLLFLILFPRHKMSILLPRFCK